MEPFSGVPAVRASKLAQGLRTDVPGDATGLKLERCRHLGRKSSNLLFYCSHLNPKP